MPGFIRQIFLTICTTSLLLALGGAPAAFAALLSYDGTVTIDSTLIPTGSDPETIDVGDQFHFSFTYDDTITDELPISDNAFFRDALTAFSLTADAGNTGTWDPTGGTFTLPTELFVQAGSGNPNRFGIEVEGTGFPALGGLPFFQLGLTLDGGFTVDDTGVGQTVNEVLGGPLPGDLNTFDPTEMQFFALQSGPGGVPSGQAIGSVTAFRAVNPVPIPNTLLLFGTGLAALIGWRARRAKTS